MGFLLFAFRKLTIKRQINQKNYQMTLLSNQRQQIDANISVMEQAKAATQDAWSTMSNTMSSTMSSVFQMKANSQSEAVKDSATAYGNDMDTLEALKQAKQNKTDDKPISSGGSTLEATDANISIYENKVKQDEADMTVAKETAQEATRKATLELQAGQQAIVLANSLVNSVFTAADNSKLALLQSQDQRIDLQMSQLESEVKLLNAEYDNVDKAEGEEAKRTAPTFGLS